MNRCKQEPSSGRASPRRSARALLSLAAGQALGAGFALQENSGSGLGNAFAGGAAAAEDASTLWSNPAGMSRLASPQVAAAVHLVTPSFKFRDDGSVPAAFQPLGGTGGDAGSLAVIPNLYAVVPLNAQWSVGIGVNGRSDSSPNTTTTGSAASRAIKSDIKTINVNPSLSWRVSNTFAVGVGVNWQRVDAELTSKRQLQRRARAGGRPGGGRRPDSGSARADDHRTARPASSRVRGSKATTARGDGTSASCGMRRRRRASARTIARRSSTTSRPTSTSTTRRCRRCRRPSRRSSGCSRPASTPCSRTAASRRTSSCRTSPTFRCFTG